MQKAAHAQLIHDLSLSPTLHSQSLVWVLTSKFSHIQHDHNKQGMITSLQSNSAEDVAKAYRPQALDMQEFYVA